MLEPIPHVYICEYEDGLGNSQQISGLPERILHLFGAAIRSLQQGFFAGNNMSGGI